MTDILSEQVPSYDILEVAPQVVSGGGGTWGSITGTLADQTDLNTALGLKANTSALGSAAFVASSTFAAAVHVHATSDVTGLDTALGLLAPKASPTFTTSATFSFLTSGRVPYATTGGSVIDSASFTYNGTALGLSAAVAATSTDGLVLATTATATSGAQKFSPRTRWSASYFNGSALSSDWTAANEPDAAGGILAFAHSNNGGAYTNFANLYAQNPYNGNTGAAWTLPGTAGAVVTRPGTSTACAMGLVFGGLQGFWASSGAGFGFTSGSATSTAIDIYLMREAAANPRLGAAASATPVAQTISVQNGSGTNIAGADWKLVASMATGNAAGGKILFQTSDVGSTGATLQTATTKFEVGVAGVGFNGTANIAKPTVTGSRGGNAALASLLTALANYGLITDSSTA